MRIILIKISCNFSKKILGSHVFTERWGGVQKLGICGAPLRLPGTDPKNPGWQKHLTPCQHTDPPISHCGMAFHYVKWHIVHSIQWPQCQITLARVGLLSTTKWPQCQITLARVGLLSTTQWPQCQITLARVGLLSSIEKPQCQITLARVGLLSSIEKPQCQITMLALWLSWPFDNAGFLV